MPNPEWLVWIQNKAKEALDEPFDKAQGKQEEQPEECFNHGNLIPCDSCTGSTVKSIHTQQPEDPTLWEGDWIASRIQAEYDKHWKYTTDWSKYAQAKIIGTLKSKLLELASEMRIEYKSIDQNRSTNEKRYPHGYNEAATLSNQRLNTFISKLK